LQAYTPVVAVHLKLDAGASVELPVGRGFNAYVYAIRGEGSTSGLRFGTHRLVEYHADGDAVRVEAVTALEFLFLAGEPIDEPVVAWGPFVMNTREEIIQARDDYLAGRMGRLDEPA